MNHDIDSESDTEDIRIKPTDNLILVGHVEGNASILEIYGNSNKRAIQNDHNAWTGGGFMYL